MKKEENTQVDLGEDLLNKPPPLVQATPPPRHLAEQLQESSELVATAKIYYNEGWVDEAKRLLRLALRLDPTYLGARSLLSEIENVELQRLLNPELIPARRSMDSGDDSDSKSAGLASSDQKPQNVELVLQNLENEFGINGVDLDEAVGDQQAQFIEKIESAVVDKAPLLDWEKKKDLAIGLIEMGMPKAARYLLESLKANDSLHAQASLLLAQSWIRSDEPRLALLELLALGGWSAMTEGEQIELFYWLGRSYQATGNVLEARHWFKRVRSMDSHYRDINERLIEGIKS